MCPREVESYFWLYHDVAVSVNKRWRILCVYEIDIHTMPKSRNWAAVPGGPQGDDGQSGMCHILSDVLPLESLEAPGEPLDRMVFVCITETHP